MHLTIRNVNTAFQTLIEGIEDSSIPTIKTPSRNGPVLQIPEPVIITYTNPRERVLFNRARDCNPFFHLYESLWMLAGRNDVAPLKYYASKIDQFSDDGETFNGAYGYRWRHVPGRDDKTPNGQQVDQLSLIIDHLKRNPESRRVVLQMWNVEDDLLNIDSSKDVCCNLSVMFSIRTYTKSELRPERFKRIGKSWKQDPEGRKPAEELSVSLYGSKEHIRFSTDSQEWFVFNPDVEHICLDMTVTNRSNDLIWGMLGANVVHFSFLQEYVACALGIEVGVYNQMSNNAHVYTETNSGWHPEKWLQEYRTRTMHSPPSLSYDSTVRTSPLLFTSDETVERFDSVVKEFVERNTSGDRLAQDHTWNNLFLSNTTQPMMHAWHFYKERDFEAALHWCSKIAGADWRVACTEWIERRQKKKGE